MKEEIPTRSICRFIDVLKVINRLGPISLLNLAKEIAIPYPTVSRVIYTLLEHGLIERVDHTKRYRATGKTLSLSNGFAEHDRLALVARERMTALTGKVGWPLALATRVGASMVARESTHHQTSLALSRCPTGFRIPVLESAAGHVHLAYAPDDERACVLDGLELMNGRSPMLTLFRSGAPGLRIRESGYATYERGQCTLDPGKISSIAVPVFDDGRLAGVLSLMLFASAMPMSDALQRYLFALQATAADISSALATGVAAREAVAGKAVAATPSRARPPLPVDPTAVNRPARRLFDDPDPVRARPPLAAAYAGDRHGQPTLRAT